MSLIARLVRLRLAIWLTRLGGSICDLAEIVMPEDMRRRL